MPVAAGATAGGAVNFRLAFARQENNGRCVRAARIKFNPMRKQKERERPPASCNPAEAGNTRAGRPRYDNSWLLRLDSEFEKTVLVDGQGQIQRLDIAVVCILVLITAAAPRGPAIL